MIFNKFGEKFSENIGVFCSNYCTANFCKNLILTLVFEKNANFFTENWQKSHKIVIITSIPGFTFFIKNFKCQINFTHCFAPTYVHVYKCTCVHLYSNDMLVQMTDWSILFRTQYTKRRMSNQKKCFL
jgi:hypothetical protein